jgi:predicted HicB family RNase H-like nuclease
MRNEDYRSYLLRYRPEQRPEWQRKADASGMSLAEWIRQALDDAPVFETVVLPKEVT